MSDLTFSTVMSDIFRDRNMETELLAIIGNDEKMLDEQEALLSEESTKDPLDFDDEPVEVS